MQLDAVKTIMDSKVIAIVRGLDAGYEQLAQAMYDGGIRAMELTFNQKDPSQHTKTTGGIRAIRQLMGDKMLVGAGTVRTTLPSRISFWASGPSISLWKPVSPARSTFPS